MHITHALDRRIVTRDGLHEPSVTIHAPMTSLTRWLSMLLCCATLLPLAQAASPSAASSARAPRDDTVARCSWDRPGRNAFRGDVVAAIDRYRDIPTPVRMKLKERMAARQYDDIVDIRRDSIEGKFQYAAAIRDMHFGAGKVCREVTRQRWTDKTHERGLVYCESEHCILVPTVCRNVSRVDRGPSLVAGDRLLAPPGAVPPAVAPPGRELPAAAATAPALPAPDAPIASSFSEAVAGAVVPLFPSTDGSTPPGEGTTPGSLISPPADGGFNTPLPLVFVPGGGGGSVVPIPGGGGGGGGGGGTPIDPGTPPVTPIPEPATWASLLAGLALLTLLVRRQRRAAITAGAPAGAPKCATQKR
jgi:PEP-CTERM motif